VPTFAERGVEWSEWFILTAVISVIYIYIYIYTHTHTHTHIFKAHFSPDYADYAPSKLAPVKTAV
jgi:hypothetical protein